MYESWISIICITSKGDTYLGTYAKENNMRGGGKYKNISRRLYNIMWLETGKYMLKCVKSPILQNKSLYIHFMLNVKLRKTRTQFRHNVPFGNDCVHYDLKGRRLRRAVEVISAYASEILLTFPLFQWINNYEFIQCCLLVNLRRVVSLFTL